MTYEPSEASGSPRRNATTNTTTTDLPLTQQQQHQKQSQTVIDSSITPYHKYNPSPLGLPSHAMATPPLPQHHQHPHHHGKSVTQPPTPQHYPHQMQQIRKMPSTISTTTTSGLGSNFTNTTSGILSSSLGSHTQPPTPSPRRKISTSSFTENLEYSEQEDNLPIVNTFRGFQLGGTQQPMFEHKDYLRNGPNFSNDGGAYGAGAHRAGYLGKLSVELEIL